jgi:hypothetical protein
LDVMLKVAHYKFITKWLQFIFLFVKSTISVQ